MIMRLLLGVLFSGFLLSPAPEVFETPSARADSSGDIPDVHYAPTPPHVVAEMLNLAGVRESDVVYDMGSGDGRIVITAALEKGARGVGIDIDPERVEESRRNAAQAGVNAQVEFRQENLFDTDLSDATVVTLYLLPELNLRLRPRLFQQLRPGTRIVSHAFDMDDWKPDEETALGRFNIYLWIIPANISGLWEWRTPGARGEEIYQLQMDQKFQQVNAVLRNGSEPRTASLATLKGDRLELTFGETGSRGEPVSFLGRINGEVIEGTIMTTEGGRVPWKAVRKPGTMRAQSGE